VPAAGFFEWHVDGRGHEDGSALESWLGGTPAEALAALAG